MLGVSLFHASTFVWIQLVSGVAADGLNLGKGLGVLVWTLPPLAPCPLGPPPHLYASGTWSQGKALFSKNVEICCWEYQAENNVSH